MSKSNLKIAIVGDYNFTYNTHHATNLAIDHAANFLEVEISYYWIKLAEVSQFKANQFSDFDGIWISPGPYKNPFLLNSTVDLISRQNIPTFVTGEGYKALIELIIQRNNLNSNGEKMISDNLVDGESFERIEILPQSKELIRIYENHSNIELTSSRYSLYPQLISHLTQSEIDIEGYNQYEEPEIISLKSHLFFLSCGFCPQISSTREIPHPLIYTFLKACLNL